MDMELGIIVHPFAGELYAKFILMVVNDQLRRARWVRGFLERELVQRTEWLARPPDMNLIEHVWDCLQRIIAVSTVQRGPRESLKRELIDNRGMIPIADIRKLI